MDEPRHVNVEELFEEIGGSTYFTKDQLLRQFVNSEDKGEDFDLIHGSTLYRVPLASIRGFFEVHKRPKIKMTAEQENAYLKKRLAEMEGEIEKLGGKADGGKTEFKAKTHRDSIVRPRPSKRDPRPEVPPEGERKAMSLTAIQEELRDQVKDKQPLTSANQGKTAGKGKPKAL